MVGTGRRVVAGAAAITVGEQRTEAGIAKFVGARAAMTQCWRTTDTRD